MAENIDDGFRLYRLLPRIINDLQWLLAPETDQEPPPDRQDVEMVHLWDPKAGPLPAGTNYGHSHGPGKDL
ncbi:hypothetical protein [Streptomyces lonegramiae]|uniref:Uncharacterized protein n=1 Tax=Streptomyces lonegramiae TaxID=3075524 RepID=A0ABU2XP29_9ACTN|nr:hypothetical protein [Streptomyces sp. DSM 41529]MDT0547685.1 hypothetical protein [Streptomyces sp. DSM 41529]